VGLAIKSIPLDVKSFNLFLQLIIFMLAMTVLLVKLLLLLRKSCLFQAELPRKIFNSTEFIP